MDFLGTHTHTHTLTLWHVNEYCCILSVMNNKSGFILEVLWAAGHCNYCILYPQLLKRFLWMSWNTDEKIQGVKHLTSIIFKGLLKWSLQIYKVRFYWTILKRMINKAGFCYLANHLFYLLREKARRIQDTIQAAGINDVFWLSSMEVNWTVRESRLLGLFLQFTRCRCDLPCGYKKMNFVICGFSRR